MSDTKTRLFISYSRSDRPQVSRLADALEARDCSVWWDARIEGGSAFAARIEENLESADVVLVVWSSASVASDWVKDEAGHGRDRRRLVPVSFDGTLPPLGFRQYHVVDLRGWNGKADAPQIDEVLRGLAAAISGSDGAFVPANPRKTSLNRRGALVAGGAGVALAATGGLAWWQGWLGNGKGNSIAVMPFKNLSGDPAQSYFSDGLAEEIRTALCRNPELQVAAPTSVAEIQHGNKGLSEIGSKLGVSYLLQGSVRRSGDLARISAELIDADTGFSRWTQSFDRKLDDIFAVQSEIAQVVCTALSLRVNMPKAGAGGTRNFAAYDTYLRAMALYRADKDEANDREALALLERAVELDANFSLARATAAYSSVAIANAYASPEEGKLLYARAIDQARKAADQSPDLANVQLALGFAILYGTRKVKDALSCYDKAYGLAAGDTQIAVPYSLFSSYLGRAAVSIEAAQRVMGLDPLNASTFRMAGLAYYHARQYDEALPLYAKAIALKRDVRNVHGYIGNILVHREQYAEARKEFEQETRAYISQPGLAIVLKAMGDKAGAERVLADFLKEFGDAVAYQEAQIRAQWGDKAGAMQTLQRAYAVMDSGLLLAKVDPMLDPVRGEPGFSRLLNDLGLA